MAIASGYRTHDEGTIHRYRVPDLLTREEFQIYMASTYRVGVDFRDLTEDERTKLDSGEQLTFTPYGPTDHDREIAVLREQLGITALEEHAGLVRKHNPSKRDPIVELDSRILSAEEFAKKYDVQIPQQKSGSTVEKKK